MAIKIVASLSKPDEIILPQESAKNKKQPFFFLFKRMRMDKWPYLGHTSYSKKSKCHFIPHVILVQMI